jgi:hypothetical protein
VILTPTQQAFYEASLVLGAAVITVDTPDEVSDAEGEAIGAAFRAAYEAVKAEETPPEPTDVEA